MKGRGQRTMLLSFCHIAIIWLTSLSDYITHMRTYEAAKCVCQLKMCVVFCSANDLNCQHFPRNTCKTNTPAESIREYNELSYVLQVNYAVWNRKLLCSKCSFQSYICPHEFNHFSTLNY